MVLPNLALKGLRVSFCSLVEEIKAIYVMKVRVKK
jgi:hypothetical protein